MCATENYLSVPFGDFGGIISIYLNHPLKIVNSAKATNSQT